MAVQRLVLRAVKGSPLTSAEADADLTYLEQLAIPAWSAADAAIAGAYTAGIVVDSKVNGCRYRLRSTGNSSVDPSTDTNLTHWEKLTSAPSTAPVLISALHTDAPAPAFLEDPTIAELKALASAKNANPGDILNYTTPTSHIVQAHVYSDGSGGIAITKDRVNFRLYTTLPSAANFQDGTQIFYQVNGETRLFECDGSPPPHAWIDHGPWAGNPNTTPVPLAASGAFDDSDVNVLRITGVAGSGGTTPYTSIEVKLTFNHVNQNGRVLTLTSADGGLTYTGVDTETTAYDASNALVSAVYGGPSGLMIGGVARNSGDTLDAVYVTAGGNIDIVSSIADLYGDIDIEITVTDSASGTATLTL